MQIKTSVRQNKAPQRPNPCKATSAARMEGAAPQPKTASQYGQVNAAEYSTSALPVMALGSAFAEQIPPAPLFQRGEMLPAYSLSFQKVDVVFAIVEVTHTLAPFDNAAFPL
jgi:hypothetical protein